MLQNRELQIMDKRIGKLFLIVTLFSTALFALKEPRISIELLSKNHQPLEEAEIGVPFIIQVTCESFKPKSDLQGLENGQDVVVQFAGSTQLMNYVNGAYLKEEYIFKYVMIIKKKGTFVLGPITAQDGSGNTIRSEKINIVVGDIAQAKHTGNEPYILDMDCEVDSVYVGQKLKIELNFCHRAGFEDLAIENTLFDDVEVGYQDKNWTTGKKIIEGKNYSCKKMGIEIFPKKVGNLIIPSFKATFISEQRQDIGLLGFFGFANSKIIESHPKQIQVIPLPDSEIYKNVQAIGKFQSATFTIDQKNGQVGEGIHAKMIIQGDGNLDILHHPELVLPEGIHFYEGNSSLERIDDTMSKKTFDWILQSDNPGNFVIDAQSFIYFDPVDKKYKKLRTNGTELVIKGAVIPKQENQQEALPQQEKKEESVDQDVKKAQPQEIKYYSSQKFYSNASSDVLTKLIIFFAVLVLILLLVLLLVPYLKKIFFIETLQYRWLFWKYSRSGDVQAIYKLYEKIATEYGFGLQSQELHQAFLKNNLSDQSFENWKNFLHMLLEFNFAGDKSLQDRSIVVDLAKEWFSIILLCCKSLRRK
jgi:hypothetical protein